MYRNTYKLKLETDPPSASSAAQDAHWLMLGDLILDPGRMSKVARRAPGTRAHQEHERLKEEILEALGQYDDQVKVARPGRRYSAMETTVREHMQRLEEKRQLLSAQTMEESDQEKRNRLEAELRAVESALKFYREALETERRLLQHGFMH